MGKEKYDTAFVDLWHDVSDGVELYIKMKKCQTFSPTTKFEYWIEKSLLSSMRWRVFEGIYEKVKQGKDFFTFGDDIKSVLSDDYLRNFAKYL